MLAKVNTAAHQGFRARAVEVECDLSSGLPSLTIVGLGSKSIDEAKERVRSALKNSKLPIPPKKITINLAPADLPKEGTSYDVAIAVAILIATKQIKNTSAENCLFVGELALDGKIRPVPGVVLHAEYAKEAGFNTMFVPERNAEEAALIRDITTIPVATLEDLYRHLIGQKRISPQPYTDIHSTTPEAEVDIAHIYGQEHAKRALEIAAAGGHNLLLSGPPGSGKTMLAKALLGILPPPSFEESLEITKLHSLVGQSSSFDVCRTRPFRSPHHTASHIALIGGGRNPRPGEISLSHNGVLFLDELPEFPRNVLEVLRQPIEDKKVTIARAQDSVEYPARFMLIATQNPCPCGFYNDPVRNCTCTAAQISRYQKKISGPLLDRIDLNLHVGRIKHEKLLEGKAESPSEPIRKKVAAARAVQNTRYQSGYRANADMTNQEIKQHCALKDDALALAEKALTSLDLSARGYMRTLKVARTIADLDQSEEIGVQHLSEALQYRRKNAFA